MGFALCHSFNGFELGWLRKAQTVLENCLRGMAWAGGFNRSVMELALDAMCVQHAENINLITPRRKLLGSSKAQQVVIALQHIAAMWTLATSLGVLGTTTIAVLCLCFRRWCVQCFVAAGAWFSVWMPGPRRKSVYHDTG